MSTPEWITKESPITLIEPAPTSGGELAEKIVGDIYAGINLPSRAIDGLRTIAIQRGYEDVVCINPRYNQYPGRLSGQDWERIFNSKVLGISTITRTAPQAERLARIYKDANPRGWVVVGGPHATFLVEECSQWADVVVRSEGDKTFPELLDAMVKNGSPQGVEGISYKDGEAIIHETDRPLLTEAELEQLPWPDFDPRFRKGVSASVISASRGCPHNCAYCSVSVFGGETYRRIGNESIISRLKQIYPEKPGEGIFYADDNFAGKPRQAEELLQQMIDSGLNKRRYVVQLRAEIGKRTGFPDLLRKAGIGIVAVGIESINEAVLASVNKKTSSKNTIEGVRALREAGILVHGMFIAGLDGDTEESLMDQLEWAKRYVDTAQVFAPVPLPGTPFARMMDEQGRILTKEYQYYSGHDVVVRPEEISPYDLQMLIYKMYEEFYSFKLVSGFSQRFSYGRGRSFTERLGDLWRDVIVRMYARHTRESVQKDPQTQRHLKNLKAWS